MFFPMDMTRQEDRLADGEGASMDDGVGARVRMHKDWEKPYHRHTHKPTRGDTHE